MSAPTSATPGQGPQHDIYKPGRQLEVSAYDNVAGLLVALLILVGFFVTILFIIWLTTTEWWSYRPKPVLIEEYAGRGEAAMGLERDLEEPGAEEVEELTEPQLEETLEAVTDVASSISATLEAMEGNSQVTGKGSGMGDSRAAGPGGEGENLIPRWERWKIMYPASDLKTYARLLDDLGIELGAAGGEQLVDYAYNLSKPKPDHRTGPGDQEERLYLTWQSGPLREADAALLQQAGIALRSRGRDRILMQFYPPELENDIAHVELAFAQQKNKEIKDIRETTFGVRQGGGRPEFYVLSQVYR